MIKIRAPLHEDGRPWWFVLATGYTADHLKDWGEGDIEYRKDDVTEDDVTWFPTRLRACNHPAVADHHAQKVVTAEQRKIDSMKDPQAYMRKESDALLWKADYPNGTTDPVDPDRYKLLYVVCEKRGLSGDEGSDFILNAVQRMIDKETEREQLIKELSDGQY